MANVALSDLEKTFIMHGVEDNLRCDGRGRSDYRSMEIETDVVTHASGSARLRLASTDILVGIKTEIDVPNANSYDKGKIDFFVDCSANAAPEFEGRGGEELAAEITDTLTKAYLMDRAFDLRQLCILLGKQCWKLCVDILILECGGNLFDAVSLAVKAALYNTRIPRVSAALLDGKQTELTLSDDPYDSKELFIGRVPILVTVSKIGDYCVVDPSAEEEECSSAGVVVGVSCDKDEAFITNIHTVGVGSFHQDTLDASVEMGLLVGKALDAGLKEALEAEAKFVSKSGKNEIFGFLK